MGEQPRGFSASQGQSQQAGGGSNEAAAGGPPHVSELPQKDGDPRTPRAARPGTQPHKRNSSWVRPPLPQHNSRPLPRLLSLITRDKSPAPSSLQPPFGWLWGAMRSPLRARLQLLHPNPKPPRTTRVHLEQSPRWPGLNLGSLSTQEQFGSRLFLPGSKQSRRRALKVEAPRLFG